MVIQQRNKVLRENVPHKLRKYLEAKDKSSSRINQINILFSSSAPTNSNQKQDHPRPQAKTVSALGPVFQGALHVTGTEIH